MLLVPAEMKTFIAQGSASGPQNMIHNADENGLKNTCSCTCGGVVRSSHCAQRYCRSHKIVTHVQERSESLIENMQRLFQNVAKQDTVCSHLVQDHGHRHKE